MFAHSAVLNSCSEHANVVSAGNPSNRPLLLRVHPLPMGLLHLFHRLPLQPNHLYQESQGLLKHRKALFKINHPVRSLP